MITVITFVVRL